MAIHFIVRNDWNGISTASDYSATSSVSLEHLQDARTMTEDRLVRLLRTHRPSSVVFGRLAEEDLNVVISQLVEDQSTGSGPVLVGTCGFTWYKGPVHVIVRREFVDYMLNNPRAKQLYNTLAHQAANKIPDETYFATLNHNPDTFPIPGAFLGVHETNWTKSIARFKIWREFKLPCGSKRWRHFICMLGWADLPKLRSSPQLFANKFIPSVEPDAYGMLELWLAEKVQYEITHGRHHPSFNLSYYSNHEMSWNHL
ncbi:hypothetical protein EG68_06304 [Paragonimus skrjabini miyazakii]|uniref:Uncharacterized protein n=1 Tax=Paragonimus skrjabini miyazakii TaxID=59628 RepID=A0A8S9Z0M3_9TREM|nr:hypothetical protein EG68_06304 [Paragonimus skrjabini miyazakii]